MPGYPSAYLLVGTEPTASSTDGQVKFSDAISSIWLRCRSSSAPSSAAISGSISARPVGAKGVERVLGEGHAGDANGMSPRAPPVPGKPTKPVKRELEFATRQFRSLEINGTFYGMQRPDAFADWAERAPEGFVFAVKAPRYITHMRKLRDVATPLANFVASGVLRLGAEAWADPVAVSAEVPL